MAAEVRRAPNKPSPASPVSALTVAALALVGIQLITVMSTARELVDSGALPALHNPVVVALGSLLWVGIFANLYFTPVGLIPLLVAGIMGSTRRQRATATVALAALWVVLTSVDLVDLGGGNFNADFPALPCGSSVEYFFSADSTSGLTWVDPPNGGGYTASVALSITNVASVDFESASPAKSASA